MKRRFVLTVVILSLFTACSKQDIQVRSLQKTLSAKQAEIKPKVYSTGWETIPAWSTEAAGDVINFSYTYFIPQLNNDIASNGLVLVFARHLWEGNNELKFLPIPDKPFMMPFYFLPYFEKPGYAEQWSYSASENKVNISLTVKGSTEAATHAKRVQLRYVLIPGEVLKAKKQSVQAIRKLSYNELMRSFGLEGT